MKKYIKRKIQEYITTPLALKLSGVIVWDLRRAIEHDMLATIGVEEMRSIVEQADKNKLEVGHSDYNNLYDFYARTILKRKQ